ncbi:MAG: NnrU family protein [Pseudomonadota bacterium]
MIDFSVLIAMAMFVLSHMLIARTGLKPWLTRKLGASGYLLAYSALSIGLMAWVIVALINAERFVLWSPPEWGHGFAALTSLIAFILMGSGGASPNIFSVSFRKSAFSYDRPGLIGWIRHPFIWGLTLWGLAHLPANGNWPGILLFGGSAVFGAIGVIALERRAKGRLGPAWQEAISSPGHITRNGLIGALIGASIWLFVLALHPVLFGVDPWSVLVAQLGLL